MSGVPRDVARERIKAAIERVLGWHLDQPSPGTMRWTTPGGRRYLTTPGADQALAVP